MYLANRKNVDTEHYNVHQQRIAFFFLQNTRSCCIVPVHSGY